MSAHTPTPWFLLDFIPLPITRAVYRDAPAENDGYQITRHELGEIREYCRHAIAEQARLNVALTVARVERDRACNSRDALVAALEPFVTEEGPEQIDIDRARKLLAALKSVRGES